MRSKARFWVWARAGWVLLALRPGESLSLYSGGRTDEGWSYTHDEWEFDGETVTHRSMTEARDCDGQMDWHNELSCGVDDLGAGPEHWTCDETARWRGQEFPQPGRTVETFRTPKWERVRSGQRDYAAEAAGY